MHYDFGRELLKWEACVTLSVSKRKAQAAAAACICNAQVLLRQSHPETGVRKHCLTMCPPMECAQRKYLKDL